MENGVLNSNGAKTEKTPKEFRHSARGCPAKREATLGNTIGKLTTLKGLQRIRQIN